MGDKTKKITVNNTCAECGYSWKETSLARGTRESKRMPEIRDCVVSSENCPRCNKEEDDD